MPTEGGLHLPSLLLRPATFQSQAAVCYITSVFLRLALHNRPLLQIALKCLGLQS